MTFLLSKTRLRSEVLYCIERIKEEGKKTASFKSDYLWHGYLYEITVTVKKKSVF